MFSEIYKFANYLCEMTNGMLEKIVREKCEYLPFFLHFAAASCYVKYDTLEEGIASIGLRMIDNNSFMIEADPISGYITGVVAGETRGSVKMEKDVADTLLACIHQCWNMRLSADSLLTFGDDDRYIAADLLE